MDPILTAVVAAIGALGNASLGEAAKKATADAYDGLKSLLKKKLGEKHTISTLINAIEVQRGSAAAVEAMGPLIADYKLGSDPEILEAARRVEAATTIISGSSIQSRVANYHGPVYGPTGDNSAATYNFSSIPETKKAPD